MFFFASAQNAERSRQKKQGAYSSSVDTETDKQQKKQPVVRMRSRSHMREEVPLSPYLRVLPPADYTRFDFLHHLGRPATTMFPPATRELSLSFFRKMFAQLAQRFGDKQGEIPSGHFERAMTRVCRLIGEHERKIDAQRYDIDGSGAVGWWEFVSCWKDNRFGYRYNYWERLSIMFEDPTSCQLGRNIQVVLMGTILLSTCLFIIGTLPDMRSWPSDYCESLCDSDVRTGVLTPETERYCEKNCEPVPSAMFELLELICVVIFTIEYVVRIISCHACRPELINLKELQQLALNEGLKVKRNGTLRVWHFFINPLNMVDLMAVAPFYIEIVMEWMGGSGDTMSGSTVLRVIRLTRLFRLLKVARYFHTLNAIVRVVQRAFASLAVLLFVLMLCVVFSGSILYYAEQGTWDVESNEYLRYNWVQGKMEATPFKSIPHSLWWSFVTYTTVGYGDMTPYTTIGQILAVLSMLTSMLSVGMPTSVLLRSFNDVWDETLREQEEQRNQAEAEREAVENVFLYSEPYMQMRRVLIEVFDDTLSSNQHDFLGQVMLEFDTIGVPHLKGKSFVQAFVRESSAVLRATMRHDPKHNGKSNLIDGLNSDNGKSPSNPSVFGRIFSKGSESSSRGKDRNENEATEAQEGTKGEETDQCWRTEVELPLEDNILKHRTNCTPITGVIRLEICWTPDKDASRVDMMVPIMQTSDLPPEAPSSFSEKQQAEDAAFLESLVAQPPAAAGGTVSSPSGSAAAVTIQTPTAGAGAGGAPPSVPSQLSSASSPTSRTSPHHYKQQVPEQVLSLAPGMLSVKIVSINGITPTRELIGAPAGTMTLDPYVTVTVWNRPPNANADDHPHSSDEESSEGSQKLGEGAGFSGNNDDGQLFSVATRLGEVVTRKRSQTAMNSLEPEWEDGTLEFKYTWLSVRQEREARRALRQRGVRGAAGGPGLTSAMSSDSLGVMEELGRKVANLEVQVASLPGSPTGRGGGPGT